MLHCVSVPCGILNILSVFVQFMAEVCSVKIPKNNDKRVWMFLLHTGYLVSQALQRLAHTGLRRDVNTGQNKGVKLLWWIKRLSVDEKSLKVRATDFLLHCDINTPTFTDIKADSVSSNLSDTPALIWSTPLSRKPCRYNAMSRVDSPRQVYVTQSATGRGVLVGSVEE